MRGIKVLLVDDDVVVRFTLSKVLEANGFHVTIASNVPHALKCINEMDFDVLISDLQMPGAGDGLTVVSAMRHANPRAATFLLSAYPDVDAGARAILLQADEILVKPMDVGALIDAIRSRLATGQPQPHLLETVASILERTAQTIIRNWLGLVELEARLMAIPLSHKLRCAHLPQVFRDLVERLKSERKLGTHEVVCSGACRHGEDRREQGYTAAMIVEEWRILQVCIFQTLQNNLSSIDFSSVLTQVMTIADEVDCQLSQAMESYAARSVPDGLPA